MSAVNGAGVGETRTVTEFTVEGGIYIHLIKSDQAFFLQLPQPTLMMRLLDELVEREPQPHGPPSP